MAKPVEFCLKGEALVAVKENELQEYLKALVLAEDIICLSVDLPRSIKQFPIMRKHFSIVDPAHMVSGGFEVERIGETNSFAIRIDGVVSTDSLAKKDIQSIASGTATCELTYVGTREKWNFGGNDSSRPLSISIAAPS
jgi:hypothetical protein